MGNCEYLPKIINTWVFLHSGITTFTEVKVRSISSFSVETCQLWNSAESETSFKSKFLFKNQFD